MNTGDSSCNCSATCTCRDDNAKKCDCNEQCDCSLDIETISAEELQDKIEHAVNLTVVNVLNPEYFEDCHIKGSINAPLSQLETVAKQWDRNREIIVYCASAECTASVLAYKLLRSMGFKKAYEYAGGMRDWKEKGFKCVGECTKV